MNERKEGAGAGGARHGAEDSAQDTTQSTKRSGEENADRTWRPHLLASEVQRQTYMLHVVVCLYN